MKSRTKCHARLVNAGVNIYADGLMLTGITAPEAVQLHRSLSRQLTKIKRRAKEDAS